jgi:hypothetical protein
LALLILPDDRPQRGNVYNPAVADDRGRRGVLAQGFQDIGRIQHNQVSRRSNLQSKR